MKRSLLAAGVEGDHPIPQWRNSVFHWQFTYSRSSRNEHMIRLSKLIPTRPMTTNVLKDEIVRLTRYQASQGPLNVRILGIERTQLR